MPSPRTLHSPGWHFAEDGTGLGDALDVFLATRPERPRLLGLGEPTHGIEAFPRLRNQALRHLVEHQGFRSIAIESDCVAGLVVNDHVTSGAGDLDDVLATGFSHGFGDLASSRELVTWLRAHNEGRDPADQVHFHGFDAPTEAISAPSPRTALTAVHRHLAAHLPPARVPHSVETIDALVGDDAAWENEAAALDPTQSVGGSAPARDLRLVADDLADVLEAEAPGLRNAGAPGEHDRARMFARTAQGLLRYHATMADTVSAPADRLSRGLAIRDTMMAANLLSITRTERERGPSLVFAHNGHLQRNPTSMGFGDLHARWWSAGAIAAATLDTRYAVIAAALGTAADAGVPDPAPDTPEGVLTGATTDRALLPVDQLAAILARRPAPTRRADASANPSYAPLDPAHLIDVDAVAFVRDAARS